MSFMLDAPCDKEKVCLIQLIAPRIATANCINSIQFKDILFAQWLNNTCMPSTFSTIKPAA